jgi:anti-sigma B factor antagonist
MPIEWRQLEPGAAVLTLSGRLVFGKEVEHREAAVRTLIGQGHRRYILDAATLEYVDSSGIGTLLSCLGEIRKGGGELRLAGVNPRIQRLLQMTGVDKLVPTFATVSEAAL